MELVILTPDFSHSVPVLSTTFQICFSCYRLSTCSLISRGKISCQKPLELEIEYKSSLMCISLVSNFSLFMTDKDTLFLQSTLSMITYQQLSSVLLLPISAKAEKSN